MTELHYAFIKDGLVKDIAVFNSEDEKLANNIALENGYDEAVFTGETVPYLFATYDGSSFVNPTNEELVKLGVIELPETTE